MPAGTATPALLVESLGIATRILVAVVRDLPSSTLAASGRSRQT